MNNSLRSSIAFLFVAVCISGCGGGGGGESGSSPTPTANAVPIASAGADQVAVTGTAITLDGSKSSDPNNDILIFSWTLSAKPSGSNSTLETGSSKPSFTPDMPGTYVASLTVNDGKTNSSPVNVTIIVKAANVAPIANAGVAQNVIAGSVAKLDGSASLDSNGDALTYMWVLSSKPIGSIATVDAPTTPQPSFSADLSGTYIASLTVNDGKATSAASIVTVTAAMANAAPVANAGVAQNVMAGTKVILNGSTSSDANGDPLTYSWTLTVKPSGSAAMLANANSVTPSFTPDVSGTFVGSLIVSDGKVNSTAATVTLIVTLANAAPVADAGPAQRVLAGSVVSLNGSASSDANSDTLTYAWRLTSVPAGSGAPLAISTSVRPTFTADVAGTYVASLIVNDGKLDSATQTTVITVVPKIAGALGITGENNSLNFCAITGTLNFSVNGTFSPWRFFNCGVFGDAGGVLLARIKNNGDKTIKLLNIHVLAGYFGNAWSIAPTSQGIAPGSTSEFSLPLWMGLEVTSAVATFSIEGEPDLVVRLSGSTRLP